MGFLGLGGYSVTKTTDAQSAAFFEKAKANGSYVDYGANPPNTPVPTDSSVPNPPTPTGYDMWGNAQYNTPAATTATPPPSDSATTATPSGPDVPTDTPAPPQSRGVSSPGTPRQLNTNVFTIAPNLADINIADTCSQLLSSGNTSLSAVFVSDGVSESEIQATMDYRNAFKQGDVITALTNFYNSLINDYFKRPDFSLDAIMFWYQKLKYSDKEISSYKSDASFYNKNIISNQIPGASLFAQNTINDYHAGEDSYFDITSDSIGIITNSKFIQLDSTLPVFDVGQQFYGVPIPFAASMDSKISAATRNVCYNLSQKTTVLMRRNLLSVGYLNTALQQNLAADSTVSHGLNLINDLPTFVNINKFLGQLKNKLSTVFTQAKLFSYVQYLNTIGNTTAMCLRDIFPLAPTDLDFTVITSEERAKASVSVARQEQADAAAAAALAYQQDSGSFNSSPAVNSNTGGSNPGAKAGTGNLNAPSSVSLNANKSDIAARNAAMDASGASIATYIGEDKNTYMNKDSFLDYTAARLQGPPASPLLGANIPDAAEYGITDTSDPQQWASYMWKVAQAEQGGKVNATGADTTNDEGGSWGAFSTSVADAKVYAGYSGVSVNDLQTNPNLGVNVGVSVMEKEISNTGSIAGMYRYGGGTRASFASTTATNVKKMT